MKRREFITLLGGAAGRRVNVAGLNATRPALRRQQQLQSLQAKALAHVCPPR